MANGRLRTMLAGLHLNLNPRRDRPSASPHHDAATVSLRPCVLASLRPCVLASLRPGADG